MPKEVSYTKSAGGTFFKPEAGGYPAIIVGIAELGTVEKEFNGKTKMVEEIAICYEIEASQEIYDSNEKKLTGQFEDKIGVISRNYSIVVNDKSKLGKVITSAYDVKSVEEIKGFSLDKLLGKSCYINIEMKGKDNNFPAITEVSALNAKMQAILHKQETKNFYFGLSDANDFIENFEEELKGKLPSWDIDRIKESPEYAELMQSFGIVVSKPKSLDEQEEELGKEIKAGTVGVDEANAVFGKVLEEEPTTVQAARKAAVQDEEFE